MQVSVEMAASPRALIEKAPRGCSRSAAMEPAAGGVWWVKIKSFPWWPAQLWPEENASEAVKKTKKLGSQLVRFYLTDDFAFVDLSQPSLALAFAGDGKTEKEEAMLAKALSNANRAAGC